MYRLRGFRSPSEVIAFENAQLQQMQDNHYFDTAIPEEEVANTAAEKNDPGQLTLLLSLESLILLNNL
jgi:hypothetical protein